MKNIQVLLLALFVSILINPVLASESREQKQAKLDAACESARQKKLAPLRQQVIDECVANKELPNREECKQFYAYYGERTGHKAALFYDLPECVTAFNFNQGYEDQD